MDNRPRTESAKITVTVGQDEGDLRGDDHRVIQAAIDYVAGLGGGQVRLLAGAFKLRNAIFMRSGVHLAGSGEETTLRKCSGVSQDLIRDADWFEANVEIPDASGYRTGDGIMMRSYVSEGPRLLSVVRETVTGIEGNVLSLSGRLRSNMWLDDRASATPLFPLITAEEETHDVRIADLVLDGNLEQNEEINGNYAGGVFIQRCDRWSFTRVTSRNYNGDGFSFQVCDDIHFTECSSEGNANLGFHPGSGSQRPVFKDCVSVRNNQGIFFCWGVSDGLVEGCRLEDNRDYGVSIGHRDTDNRIVDTDIEGNLKVGVLFRDERVFRAGHRNNILNCRIRDNGSNLDGVGVDIRGETADITLHDNDIGDTGTGQQKVGVRIGDAAKRIHATRNQFSGLEVDVQEESN